MAKKYGLMGSTDEETALIDGLAEHQRDIQDAFRSAKREGGEKLEEYMNEKLPASMTLVEKAVAGQPGPFLLGDKPCLADVLFFVFLTETIDDKEKAKAAYEGCAKLKSAVDAVSELPAITQWQANRPATPF